MLGKHFWKTFFFFTLIIALALALLFAMSYFDNTGDSRASALRAFFGTRDCSAEVC